MPLRSRAPRPGRIATGPGAPGYALVLAVLTALVASVAVAWAVLTPPFRAPDEPQHLNSVVRLAYGGGWPEPGQAAMAPAILDAQAEAALHRDLPGRYHDRPSRAQFTDAEPTPDAERTRLDARGALADGPADDPADIDQMTQHPPLYYALGAAVLRAAGLADARWDVQLLALRLLDVALFVPVVPLAAACVRRLTGSDRAALLAATPTLFAPQVGHVLGSVTNDALMTLSGAVATYLCVRVLTGDLRSRTAVALGVVVGLGLLTKVMAGLALPMVVLAYALAGSGAPVVVRLTRTATTLGVAFVVGGWWWARNLLVYGTVQPDGMGPRFEDVPPGPFWTFWPTAVGRLVRSSFGDLGWLELRAPVPFLVVAALAVVALTAAAVRARGTRRAVVTLLSFPLLLAVTVLGNAWRFYSEHGWYAGIQGRYLFGALVAVSAVLALGAWWCLGGDPRKGAVALPVVVLLGGLVAAWGLWFGLTGMYRGPGEHLVTVLERWAGWSPLGGWALGAVLAGVLGVGLAALSVSAILARRVVADLDGRVTLRRPEPDPVPS